MISQNEGAKVGREKYGLKENIRTKQMIVDGKEVEANLIAGGPSFKIYDVPGKSGYLIVKGSKKVMLDDKRVSKYVNLRYQPIQDQENIKKEFDQLVASL
jgi:hypothetical protein